MNPQGNLLEQAPNQVLFRGSTTFQSKSNKLDSVGTKGKKQVSFSVDSQGTRLQEAASRPKTTDLATNESEHKAGNGVSTDIQLDSTETMQWNTNHVPEISNNSGSFHDSSGSLTAAPPGSKPSMRKESSEERLQVERIEEELPDSVTTGAQTSSFARMGSFPKTPKRTTPQFSHNTSQGSITTKTPGADTDCATTVTPGSDRVDNSTGEAATHPNPDSFGPLRANNHFKTPGANPSRDHFVVTPGTSLENRGVDEMENEDSNYDQARLASVSPVETKRILPFGNMPTSTHASAADSMGPPAPRMVEPLMEKENYCLSEPVQQQAQVQPGSFHETRAEFENHLRNACDSTKCFEDELLDANVEIDIATAELLDCKAAAIDFLHELEELEAILAEKIRSLGGDPQIYSSPDYDVVDMTAEMED